MLLEERRQLAERDDIHAVVQTGMVGTRDDHEFLGLCSRRVSGFAEVARVRFLAMNDQCRAR